MSGNSKLTKEDLEKIIGNIVESKFNKTLDELRKENNTFAQKFMVPPKTKKDKPDSGMVIARLISILAINKGDQFRAENYAKKKLGEDHPVTKALSSGEATAGGFLVGEEMSSDIIELLRPKTVVRSSNPVVVPMASGNLSLPKLTAGSNSQYIGENNNIVSSEQEFGMVKLTFRKLVTLVPISNDLIRFASYRTDTIVRDDISRSMAIREDYAFLRGEGTEFTPKGIRNWAVAENILVANPTVNLDNVTKDMSDMILALEDANVDMVRPTWFMNPKTKQFLMTIRDGNGQYAFRDDMLRGTFWGFPFKTTTQLARNMGTGGDESEMYLVDMSDAVIGESLEMTIDASGEASYFDGQQLQSSYSRDQTIIRAISEHDFVMRHDKSIAILTEIKWGNP